MQYRSVRYEETRTTNLPYLVCSRSLYGRGFRVAARVDVCLQLYWVVAVPILAGLHQYTSMAYILTPHTAVGSPHLARLTAGGDMETQDSKPAHVFPEYSRVKRHL